MATVYKRGDAYYLNWSELKNGKKRQRRESLGTTTAQRAEAARVAKELELLTGKQVFLPPTAFDVHVTSYLEWHKVKFPSSHQRIAQICRDAFDDFRGKQLADITRQGVELWLAKRETRVGVDRHKKKAIAASETAAKELRTLKAVLNAAVNWGKLDKNPAGTGQGSVKPPKNKRSAPIHFYTRDELSRIYELSELAPVWRLMANTGMRRAEARHLKWEHVNLEIGELVIISTDEERTKSGKYRTVPLTDGARQSLELLKQQTGHSEYVLPRMTGPSLSRCFANDIKALGLKGSLHSLRHTYASHLVMAGVPLRTVQVLMGHESFATTEKYAKLLKDHLVEQARLVSL